MNINLQPGDTCAYLVNTICGLPQYQFTASTVGFAIESLDYLNTNINGMRFLQSTANSTNSTTNSTKTNTTTTNTTTTNTTTTNTTSTNSTNTTKTNTTTPTPSPAPYVYVPPPPPPIVYVTPSVYSARRAVTT